MKPNNRKTSSSSVIHRSMPTKTSIAGAVFQPSGDSPPPDVEVEDDLGGAELEDAGADGETMVRGGPNEPRLHPVGA